MGNVKQGVSLPQDAYRKFENFELNNYDGLNIVIIWFIYFLLFQPSVLDNNDGCWGEGL